MRMVAFDSRSLFRRGWLALLIGMGAACGNSDVALDVAIPRDLVDTTVWFEVGAFKDASCAAVSPMLANGLPEGPNARVAFRRDDAAPPKFGDIPTARYAFAAVARGADCSVVASGCREEDVADTDLVSIPLTASEAPSGKCPRGATCQAGKCIPANDNADPSVGAGCSLELLGAGPLANPDGGGSGWLVSAPAIATTPTGFVIAYRIVDPNGAGAWIKVLPIDSSGGALIPLSRQLPKPCTNSDETDGVGLVVKGDAAMMALAKAPCGSNPELQLLNYKTTTPELTLGKFVVSTTEQGKRVFLGPARAAATRPSGDVVVFTEGATGVIATMDPEKGIVAPRGIFGGAGVITNTWVAANDKVLALLAAGTGESTQGTDGGKPADAKTESTLRLLMLQSNTALDTLTSQSSAPITFPGEWGSLAAIGGRVIVMSDGSGPSRSVSYRAFDFNTPAAAVTDGFAVEGATGKATAGDVTIVGDRAYFAALKQGTVALHVYGNASTTLTRLRSVLFAREPRISAINAVRDGRVAVTATDKRVAVVWTTAKVLGRNDGTGGYAVFACTE